MREIFVLVGKITSEGYEKLNKNLNNLDKTAKQVSNKLAIAGKKVERVGVNLTKLTAPIAVAGAAIIKFGADFDKAMTNSLAIMGDVSDSMKNDMEKAARDVAKTTKFSAKEAAESYYFLASAGLDAAKSIEALPRVAAFAQAGNFDMARATDLLTDAQSALGLVVENTAKNMENMNRVSDVLVKANTLANASVEQFSEALTNKAGAALRVLGKEVEEGAAVLAVYADQGVKGAEAGSQLNIVLRDLQKAAINNKKAFKEAKVSVYDTSGEMRNMGDIIADLEDRFEGMSDEQKRAELTALGFTDKSISATVALLGTSDAIKDYEAALKEAGGTTDEVANEQIKNFWDQLGLLKDRLIDIGLTLWKELNPVLTETIIPALEKTAEKIEDAAKWFKNLDPRVKDVAVKFGLLAVTLPPLLIAFGKFLQIGKTLYVTVMSLKSAVLLLNSALLANPFVLAAAAVGVFAFAIKTAIDKYDELKDAHKEWEIMTAGEAASKKFSSNLESLRKKMMAYGDKLNDAAFLQENFGETIDDLTEQARNLGYEVEGNLIQKYQRLQEVYADVNNVQWEYTDGALKAVKTTKEQSGALEELDDKIKKVKTSTKDLNKEIPEEIKALQLEMELNNDRIKTFKELAKVQTKYLKEVTERAEVAAMNQIQYLEYQAEKEKEIAEKTLNDKEEIVEAKLNIDRYYTERRNEIEKQLYDQIIQYEKDVKAERERNIYKNIELSISAVEQLFDIWEMDTNNKLLFIDQQLQKNIEAINQSLMSEAEKQKAIEALNLQADKKRKALMIKQAKRDKAAAIFKAIIDTASAVAEALPNIPLAIIMGLLGAAQIALIAAQPLPKLAKGATIRSKEGGTPAILGEGTEDEAILPMKTGIKELVNGIISGLSGAVLPSGIPQKVAGAGTSTVPATPFGNTVINWNIGTLIADDKGLKELDKRLDRFRIAERQRKGIEYSVI